MRVNGSNLQEREGGGGRWKEVEFMGPGEREFGGREWVEGRACGMSISTYPWAKKKQKRLCRDGTPICDTYSYKSFCHGPSVAVVTDGCNWGERAMTASKIANKAFVDYVCDHVKDINSTRTAGKLLLKGVESAQKAIMSTHQTFRSPAGTTTLLGGILLRKEKRSLGAAGDEVLRYLRRNKNGSTRFESQMSQLFETGDFSHKRKLIEKTVDLLTEILNIVFPYLQDGGGEGGQDQASLRALRARLHTGDFLDPFVCSLEREFLNISSAEDWTKMTQSVVGELEKMVLLWGEVTGDDSVAQILMADIKKVATPEKKTHEEDEGGRDLSLLTEEKIKKLKLRDVFADPALTRIYTKHISEGMASENILFWQAAQKFRKSQGPARREQAEKIYQNFINLENSCAFLVTHDERTTLEEQRFMDVIPDSLFECVESRVYLELADLLRNFALSGKFAQEIAKEAEKKEKKKTKEEGKRWGKKVKTQNAQRSEILGESRVDRLERNISRSLQSVHLVEKDLYSSSSSREENSDLPENIENRISLKAVPFSHRPSPSSSSTTQQEFVFVCCGVGDCKAYAYLKDERRVVDFTTTSRAWSKNDATDPGGRLGPFKQQKHPDLRNLHCSSVSLKENDLIVIVSDGVHDNLDPEHLGLSPSDCSLSELNWSDESSHIHQAKVAYAENLLLQLIESEGSSPTPEFVTQKLIAHSKKTTKAARKWLENNDRRLPKDYVAFPGKMDHTSCLCFLVTDQEPQPHLFSRETIVDSEKEEKDEKEKEKEEKTEEDLEGWQEEQEEERKNAEEEENMEKEKKKEEEKKEEEKKEEEKKEEEEKEEEKKEEEKEEEKEEKEGGEEEMENGEVGGGFVF